MGTRARPAQTGKSGTKPTTPRGGTRGRPGGSERSPEERQFEKIAAGWLEEKHRLFPQEASELGLREYDGELGANDPETHVRYGKLAAETLRAVEALPESRFRGNAWLDRKGLLALLRTDRLFHRREQWRINPQTHSDAAIQSVFLLIVRNHGALRAALPAIESRLAKLPRFLEGGAECVRQPVPLWTKLAAQSCEGAGKFLDGIAEELQAISPNAARTKQLLTEAKAAFARYGAAICRKKPGAAGSFSLGRADFEELSRERTGLPHSLEELKATGNALVERLTAELRAEARKFGRKSAAQIIEEAANRWQPEAGSLIEEYRRVTLEVRTAFDRADVVTLPQGERCRVLSVPAFLRHQFPTAAYHQPGAFDPEQTGIFWVNDLSTEARDATRREAEVRQHFGIAFTCAHEAYPGHHLQFCVQNQHPSKLRRLFHHAIFYEGWTLWCEKMAIDRGIIDFPEARLIQLHDALWRAHRIGIDCGLQEGTLSVAGACQRLQEGVQFTAARARADVNWYTSAPTVPMSYLLGRLEVERLHRYRTEEEGLSLRSFNDWILSFGAIPWSWIWESRLRQGR